MDGLYRYTHAHADKTPARIFVLAHDKRVVAVMAAGAGGELLGFGHSHVTV